MKSFYEREKLELKLSELENDGWGRGPEWSQVLGFLSGVEVRAVQEAVIKYSEFT